MVGLHMRVNIAWGEV